MEDYQYDNDTYMYYENNTMNETAVFQPLPFLPRFFLVINITLIIIANTTVLIVLGRMKNCLTKMKLFLQSLALADLCVGLIWLLIHIENILGFDIHVLTTSYWICLMELHLLVIVLTVSVLTLSIISIERYIAVVRPFKYHTLITQARSKYAVVSVWLFSTMLYLPVYLVFLFTADGTSANLWDQRFKIALYSCFYILSIIIVPNAFISLYCYSYIIKCIMRRGKFVSKHQSSMQHSQRHSERTLAKISISVFSGFYITWLPFVVVSFIAYLNLVEINEVVYHATLNIGLWNSVLNSIIYSISHKPFQAELKRLILPAMKYCCCCCPKKARQETPKCCNSQLRSITNDLKDSRRYSNNRHMESSRNIWRKRNYKE